jgi:MarR family transcriptional regulator for hemolysin
MEPRPTAPSESLGRTLVFTAKELREAFEHELAAAGASLPIWIVLSAISDVGLVSQAVLASHLHLEGATITHHVDRLESLGLVARHLDPADRRVRHVRLTSAGEALYRSLLASVGRFEREVLAGVGEQERKVVCDALARIRENLGRRRATDAAPAGR